MYSVQRKPSDFQKRERRLDVGRVQVEVVDARERRAALQVEALQLRLELAHLVEEREREAERVAHVQRRAPCPGARRRRCASRSRARRSRRRARRGRSSARTRKREPRDAGDRPLAQDERVVRVAPPSRAGRARLACARSRSARARRRRTARTAARSSTTSSATAGAHDVVRRLRAGAAATSSSARRSPSVRPPRRGPAAGCGASRARRGRSRCRSRSRTRSRRPRARCPSCLTPPNGVRRSRTFCELIQHMPVSMACATRCARRMSFVQT